MVGNEGISRHIDELNHQRQTTLWALMEDQIRET